jgi:murein DD-endopeptidase MepM/ murein hydrolase activator NlpD
MPVEQENLLSDTLPEPERTGIYHKVKKNETIWRIAKVYEVPIQDIIRSNNIPDVAQLEENQLVFVPGAHSVREIVPEPDEKEDDFIWPVQGDVINYFHSLDGGMINKGIDIRAPKGSPVKAARSGQVVFADDLTGYGKTVVLKHTGGFHTVYARNSEILVKVGDQVTKNTPICRVGRGNRAAHLHFQIRKDAIENNPLHYLP